MSFYNVLPSLEWKFFLHFLFLVNDHKTNTAKLMPLLLVGQIQPFQHPEEPSFFLTLKTRTNYNNIGVISILVSPCFYFFISFLSLSIYTCHKMTRFSIEFQGFRKHLYVMIVIFVKKDTYIENVAITLEPTFSELFCVLEVEKEVYKSQ